MRYDLTGLSPKWKDREHLRAALDQHLKDTQAAIGTEKEQKELMDLALITHAYRKAHVPANLQKERWEKFQSMAAYPSLAKQADERVQGPYLRYDNEVSNKAIGQPPEEQQSPAFSRAEPPYYGGYTTSPVSLPRYQFEVSEQPTMGTSKALPSAKESVASVIEKIAQAVDDMNMSQAPIVVMQAPQEKPSGSFVPPLVGAVMGAPLGWYAGNEYGMAKLPGYHALDQAFNALTSRRGILPNEPILQNAADIAGGTIWGKKEILKMLGPIGAYRLGGAALGLGGGMLAGALINKAMES